MIHYLLYSFPKDRIEQSKKKFFWQFIASLLISVVSLFCLLYDFSLSLNILIIIHFITTIGGLIWFGITLRLTERNKEQSVDTDFQKHNDTLDKLRKILIEAKYNIPTSNTNSSSTQLNWYTKDKLEYLIKEFEKLAFPTSILDSPEIKPLIFFLTPIAAFAGGAIAEKAELSITIGIAVIAITVVLGIWGIIQLAESLFDIISFSNSKRQIKRIYYLLNELYIRDFDDSIPSQTNNP